MRASRLLFAGLAVVAVALVVGAVLVARDGGAVSAPGRSMSIRTSLTPRTHVFAEPVVADVELEFDSRRVNPDTVRVDAPFGPYEQLGDETRSRDDVGNLVRISYRYELGCFSRRCLPEDTIREVDLPSVRVIYSLREVRGRVNDSAQWPPLRITSRLGAVDAPRARWRADLGFPAVTYRLSPGWLAALLLVSSLACLGAAGALGLALAPRRSRLDTAELAARPQTTPLERALEVLARENGSPPDRRRALERLARELAVAGLPALAGRARELAWSPRVPSGEAVDALTADVREAL